MHAQFINIINNTNTNTKTDTVLIASDACSAGRRAAAVRDFINPARLSVGSRGRHNLDHLGGRRKLHGCCPILFSPVTYLAFSWTLPFVRKPIPHTHTRTRCGSQDSGSQDLSTRGVAWAIMLYHITLTISYYSI